MRFVCRSRLTNTKISIDKRRLSDIFVFVAHSPHRNKNVMFEPKKSSTRDTIFFFSSQMQKIQVTSNSTTVQPLHSLYNNWILSDILLLIFWIPAKQKKLFVTRGFWVRRYVALVVSVPIPLRTQLVRTPTRRKIFLRNYGKQKSANEHLTQTNEYRCLT